MSRMNRRGFIHQSGKALMGAAAGLTILRGTGSAWAANDEIGIAVVGIHGRGQSHIDAYCGMPGVRVVALCDPDTRLFADRAKRIEQKQGQAPKCYPDLRKCLEDPNVNAISIATCNHWHALATIWGCQAGKDVYVEKPASWCVREGRKMVEAAEKYQRVVQVGTQSRSSQTHRNAVALMRAGGLGQVYMARALCFKPRGSIGVKEPTAVPEGLDFDLWLGPGPEHPYHENLVHYNWHWFWDFGNGDIGNQGAHEMDIARWGLGKTLPVKVFSSGGRFGYQDQGQTPNTQMATFEYGDGSQLVFEVRGHYTNDEAGVRVGNFFYGSEGYIETSDGFKPHLGPKGDGAPKPGLTLPPVGGSGEGDHFKNFVNAVRSRKREDLNADILEGHLSAAHCHLANISYRLGRALQFDPVKEVFIGDEEANKLLTRKYRKPFVVPEKV